jgi:3D (Asp-Asp-Asp) domain-containing protein
MRRWFVAIAASAVVGLAASDRLNQKPKPRGALGVSATAYCVKGTTRSGVHTRRGIVAADPRVLPLGSVVRVEGLAPRHNGVYTVSDTGRAVKGREIDIFMPDCAMAERFGRQAAQVHVLQWGSNDSG